MLLVLVVSTCSTFHKRPLGTVTVARSCFEATPSPHNYRRLLAKQLGLIAPNLQHPPPGTDMYRQPINIMFMETCIPTEHGTPNHVGVANLVDPQALLAHEMSNLSVQERTNALEDLHGVAFVAEETPEVVDSRLAEFDWEITRRKNRTYGLAESLSKDYVSNREIRLMFLRADSFDVSTATTRFMNFLENKLALFGLERLTKRITLADLTPDDLEVVESGFLQALADTDRSGRVCVCIFQQQRKFKRHENMVSSSDICTQFLDAVSLMRF
jgi:hypothetical protein